MHFPYPCALKREIEYPIEGRCCHINKGQREHAKDFSFFWWRDQDIKQISSREDGDIFFFREIHSRGDIILLKQKKDFWLEKEKEDLSFFWEQREVRIGGRRSSHLFSIDHQPAPPVRAG